MSDFRPQRIIVHCSDTEDGDGINWAAIVRYHKEVNGWADVGYHFGLEWVAGKYVALQGRPWYQKGAHCKAAGRNNDSLGVCIVGKFDDRAPTFQEHESVCNFLASLCFAFRVPVERVHGHREFEPGKTCPGTRWNLDELRRQIAARLVSPLGHRLVLAERP